MRYEYFFPANDDETVLLIDIWKNQQAIDMKVERFISDDSGIPSTDEKFIRE